MGDEPLDNLLNDLPIDIDTLAALVEGDLGCPEADAVRERLLVADPELAARVEMMCRDRVLLRALGDERPPAGLAESVIARLEREALLGLTEGESFGGPLPISRVRTVRPSRWAGLGRWLASPAGTGLAMAAVTALAIGIGLQVLPRRSGRTVPRPEPIGIAESASGPAERSLALDGGPAKPVVAEDVPLPPDNDGRTDPLTEAPTSPRPDPAMIFTGDPDRALALLAEGRLLVRVRSDHPETTIAELGRFAGRSVRPGEAWRLESDVAEPIAAALASKFEPSAPNDEPRILADGGGRGSAVGPWARLTPESSALEAVYVADARLDRAAMASLRSALSLGNGQVAVFEELAEPLELPRVLTPDAVLWWGRPAGEWVKRGYLPIVVERVER